MYTITNLRLFESKITPFAHTIYTQHLSYKLENLLWFALVVTGLGVLALACVVTAILPCLTQVVEAVLVHTLVYNTEYMGKNTGKTWVIKWEIRCIIIWVNMGSHKSKNIKWVITLVILFAHMLKCEFMTR